MPAHPNPTRPWTEGDDLPAGSWIVVNEYGSFRTYEVERAAAKIVRLKAMWIKQAKRADVIACFADKERAEHLCQALGGVWGEFERRRRAADEDRHQRVFAAQKAAMEQQKRVVEAALAKALGDA